MLAAWLLSHRRAWRGDREGSVGCIAQSAAGVLIGNVARALFGIFELIEPVDCCCNAEAAEAAEAEARSQCLLPEDSFTDHSLFTNSCR